MKSSLSTFIYFLSLPGKSIVNMDITVFARKVRRPLKPELNDGLWLARDWSFLKRNVFRRNDPQTLARRSKFEDPLLFLRFEKFVCFGFLITDSQRITTHVALALVADDFPSRARVVAVTPEFGVTVKTCCAFLTVFTLGVVQAEAAAVVAVAHPGGEVFVAVTLTGRASNLLKTNDHFKRFYQKAVFLHLNKSTHYGGERNSFIPND